MYFMRIAPSGGRFTTPAGAPRLHLAEEEEEEVAVNANDPTRLDGG